MDSLTRDDQIRREYAGSDEITAKNIGEKYGVSPQRIWQILGDLGPVRKNRRRIERKKECPSCGNIFDPGCVAVKSFPQKFCSKTCASMPGRHSALEAVKMRAGGMGWREISRRMGFTEDETGVLLSRRCRYWLEKWKREGDLL